MLTSLRKILNLLGFKEKWKLLGLAIMGITVALLELVGITTLFYFMRLVTQPEVMHDSAILSFTYDWLEFESPTSFLRFTGCVLLGQIALTNGAGAFSTWVGQRFCWRQNHLLSVRLLEHYIGHPYAFFITRNTAGLSRKILEEVRTVVDGVLFPILGFFSGTVMTLALLVSLAVLNPILTISMAVCLGGAYSAIYGFFRTKQRQLGEGRLIANTTRFRIVSEALGGIKTVKVLGREAEFVRRFVPASRAFSDAAAANGVVSVLPRYAMETLAFGGIVMTVLAYLSLGQALAQVIPTLSVFAFAAYKLMPALNALFANLVRVRFNTPALDELYADFLRGTSESCRISSASIASPMSGEQTSDLRPVEPCDFERTLELEGIRFAYENSKAPALREISMMIGKNEAIGIVGPTGSGKSTLVDILLGLLIPQAGRICVDGRELKEASYPTWRANCGYVTQDIFLCDDTIRANIAFGLPDTKIDNASVERAARVAQLHDFIVSLEHGYATVVGERGVRLSGGQRQRIGIARALLSDPKVLVLDEATSALDGITEAAFITTIRDLVHQKTMVVVAHRLATVRHCDTIYVLDAGRIVAQGSYDQLASQDPTFRAMARLGDP